MITIIADARRLNFPPAGALIGESANDYVALRYRIREALDLRTNLTIYVTSPVLLHALEDLRQYHGSVVWRNVDPSAAFERIFAQPPTSPLNTDILAKLDLDTIPLPDGSVDPLSWLLRHRVGPMWAYPVPPAGHEREIVSWAARTSPPSAVVQPLLAAQLTRWSEESPLYLALRADHLVADAQAILIRAALSRYDVHWVRRQSWGNVPLFELPDVEEVTAEVIRSVESTLADYWKHRYAAADSISGVIDIALEQMSGLAKTELDELIVMLQDHPLRLTPPLFDQIAHRFRLPRFASTLQQLQRYVMPPEPAQPELDWEDGRWLRWATHEYMPYFAWAIRSGVSREHQEEHALRFSDWLYQRYPAWLTSDNSPVAVRQYRELRSLLDTDPQAYVLWVIVDGLAWWHGDMLIDECRHHALYPQTYEAGMSVLPSITSISKRALITGVTTIDLDNDSVAEVGRKHFVESGIGAYISYRPSDIRASIENLHGPRCLVLLHNMVDVLAHKLPEFSDGSVIRGCLADLAGELGSIRALCERRGRRLHVLIGSDHGGTLLPADSSRQILPQSSREIEDLWEPAAADREQPRASSRAAVVLSPERMSADEYEMWYVLSRERFQLDRHYIVPRGHGYIGRRPEGWTHGGLTPEEVIVPLMRLSGDQPRILAVQVQIEGILRARSVGTIDVVIINPNRLPLEHLRLHMVDVDDIELDILDSSRTARFSIQVQAPLMSGEMWRIDWTLSFHVLGKPQRQDGNSSVTVRHFSVDSSGFEDLFEE